MRFDIEPINDAAVRAIDALHSANEARAEMLASQAAAIAAIRKFNAARRAHLAAIDEAFARLGESARANELMIESHFHDVTPAEIPDPSADPDPRPPVAEAAVEVTHLDVAGARARRQVA